VINKEVEEILIYKDLTIEIQGMWNVKAKVTAITTGGNWNHLKVIQNVHELHNRKTKQLETTAMQGTVHLFAKAHVAIGLRPFVLRRFTIMMVLKTEGQLYKKYLKKKRLRK
jgi:hypothetical protein